MTIEVVTRVDEMERLEKQWNRLADRFGTPFHSFEWRHACAQASSPHGDLTVVVLRSQGELIGIAPLICTRRVGVPTLAFLGDPLCKLFEPNELIYRDEQALSALLHVILSLGKPVWLEKVSATPPLKDLLKGWRWGNAVVHPGTASRSLQVPVNDREWSAFESELRKSSRENLRRKRKLAASLGEVRFKAISPGVEDVPIYLKRFLRVEAAGWKSQAGTALEANPHQQRFFQQYLSAAARQGTARVFLMWIGHEIAAMKLAVRHCDRLWELKIGYDEKFKRCSPGILLTHETLRHVFEQKLKGYEFNGEEESWERTWTDESHAYQNYRLYPLNLCGMTGFARDALHRAVGRGMGTVV